MCNYDYFRRPYTASTDCDCSESFISSENVFSVFSGCSDFEFRKINIGLEDNIHIIICWLDGLISGTDLAENVLRPLSSSLRLSSPFNESSCLKAVIEGAVYSYSPKRQSNMCELISDLCHGRCALIFDGIKEAVSFDVRSAAVRAVGEPTLEKSLKGAKDSFTETLRVNTALIRRRLATPGLKLAESSIGRRSGTGVALMFLEGLASPELVEEAARRLDEVDIDALLSTGSLEEYIVDSPLLPFPQLIHTERPDRFAMYLADGRIGLLIDGIPVGLVLPVTFAEFMKVTGDSNMHFTVTSSLNLLRYLALFLSLFLPAFYVAVAMYHQEMIPTGLLLSIIEAKKDVPFSTGLEVLSMIVAFGLLQEAGLRLPNPIGDTVSIIGALIVGQSAVEARLVSPIAIIVVAVSGISCYTLPSQDMGSAVRIAQLILLLSAIIGGLFGIAACSCVFLLLLCSMDSFGLNYTAPLSDGRPWSIFRLLLRPPRPLNKFRDPQLNTPDKRRQK